MKTLNYLDSIHKRIVIYSSGDNIVIRRNWYTKFAWLNLFAFPYLFYFEYFANDVFFSFLSYIFSLLAGYLTLCMFFNKTDLIVTPIQIRVRTYPFPWFDNIVINASEISSFFVRVRKGRGGTNYYLMYVKTNKQESMLLRCLPEESQAIYICNALKKYYFQELKPGAKCPEN